MRPRAAWRMERPARPTGSTRSTEVASCGRGCFPSSEGRKDGLVPAPSLRPGVTKSWVKENASSIWRRFRVSQPQFGSTHSAVMSVTVVFVTLIVIMVAAEVLVIPLPLVLRDEVAAGPLIHYY